MPISHETGICEWMAPKRPPAPTTERITSGTPKRPCVRKWYFVAWLISESIESARKSPNMISSTGRRPVTAAPYAAPVIASSEIGVSKTRVGPCVACSPGVAANTPPAIATSSPKRITRSSRASSSSSAPLIPSRNPTSAICPSRDQLDRMLEQHAHALQEARGVGAVDDALVARQGHVHAHTRHDRAVVGDHGAPRRLADGEDRRLRLIDHS